MEREKTPTRRDVAKLAGVSETIVSYVLNNNRVVAKSKREKVLKAIEELNYYPNNVARALKRKRTNHILFICDDISTEYFGKLVEEMDRITYEEGYLISLLHSHNDDSFVSQVCSRCFDGIVISSTSLDEKYVVRLIQSGTPTVLLMNREYDSISGSAAKIYTGIYDGMKKCVRMLYNMGRRHIIYIDRISRRHRFSTIADWRYCGFLTEMQECGLKVTKDNIIVGYETEEQLRKALKDKLCAGLKADGIIGRNDNLAIVAMKAAQECGMRIPEDVAVLGFDNSKLSSYSTPSLSSVEMNRPGIARAIIDAFEQMERGESPPVISLQANIVQRKSTMQNDIIIKK